METNLTDIQEPLALKGDGFDKLLDSIKTYGLFHQILVKPNPGGKYSIIAGRQRYLAHKELALPTINCQVYDVPNAHEISLHENLRRHNLQWFEQVELEKELHDLRISQHGAKRIGRDWGNNPGWSKEDTARELGLATGTF